MATWIRKGVFGELEIVAAHGLRRVEQLYAKSKKELYILSIREGEHAPGSLYYMGYAWDQGVNGVPLIDVQNALGKDFKVTLTNFKKCYSIQFDPKRK